jgi:hypothetical protein
MKKTELVKILIFLSDSYGWKFRYPKDSDSSTDRCERTWLDWIGEFEYNCVMEFLEGYLKRNSEQPPTPMAIANELEKYSLPDIERITPDEAYQMAIEILCTEPKGFRERFEEAKKNYDAGKAYCFPTPREFTEEEYEKLPEKIQRTVNAMGGMDYFIGEKKDTYFRHQFLKAYERISDKIDEEPPQHVIEALQDSAKRIANNFRSIEEKKNE